MEFGCGVGYFANRLSRHTTVYGLEINEFALGKLKKIAPNVQSIMATSSLPCDSVGSIVALHVFEHIADDALVQIGEELNRIMQAGGRMLAVMPDLFGKAHLLKGGEWSAFSDATHINLKSSSQWRIFFQEKWGFDVIASFSDGYYDFPYGKSVLRSVFADLFRAVRTFFQFILARPLLIQGDGENIIFILEKRL